MRADCNKSVLVHHCNNPGNLKSYSEYWLVGFDGISAFVGYLMPNPFHKNNQFYFKQFSLARVHSLIVKNISISS